MAKITQSRQRTLSAEQDPVWSEGRWVVTVRSKVERALWVQKGAWWPGSWRRKRKRRSVRKKVHQDIECQAFWRALSVTKVPYNSEGRQVWMGWEYGKWQRGRSVSEWHQTFIRVLKRASRPDGALHSEMHVATKGRCKFIVGAYRGLRVHISGLWVHLHPQRDIKLHPWLGLFLCTPIGNIRFVVGHILVWLPPPRSRVFVGRRRFVSVRGPVFGKRRWRLGAVWWPRSTRASCDNGHCQTAAPPHRAPPVWKSDTPDDHFPTGRNRIIQSAIVNFIIFVVNAWCGVDECYLFACMKLSICVTPIRHSERRSETSDYVHECLIQTEDERRRREAGVKQSMEIWLRSCMYICMYVCMYVYMWVCMVFGIISRTKACSATNEVLKCRSLRNGHCLGTISSGCDF